MEKLVKKIFVSQLYIFNCNWPYVGKSRLNNCSRRDAPAGIENVGVRFQQQIERFARRILRMAVFSMFRRSSFVRLLEQSSNWTCFLSFWPISLALSKHIFPIFNHLRLVCPLTELFNATFTIFQNRMENLKNNLIYFKLALYQLFYHLCSYFQKVYSTYYVFRSKILH